MEAGRHRPIQPPSASKWRAAIIIRSSAATDKGDGSKCPEPSRTYVRLGSADLHAYHFPTLSPLVHEARKTTFGNRATSLCEEPLVIRQVVHREKHGPQHFACLK